MMKVIELLLVEDNEGDILLVKEALEQVSQKIILSLVRDGKEAIDFLGKKGKHNDAKMPDLVWLDINLPKKNGHEVLQFIKQNDLLNHIPVIIFTTSSSERDINFAYENFANCFITKPVDVNEFLTVVTSSLSYWISMIRLPTIKTIHNEKRY